MTMTPPTNRTLAQRLSICLFSPTNHRPRTAMAGSGVTPGHGGSPRQTPRTGSIFSVPTGFDSEGRETWLFIAERRIYHLLVGLPFQGEPGPNLRAGFPTGRSRRASPCMM